MKARRTIFLLIITILFGCGGNKPKGLYEFVSAKGEIKSFNIISDTTAVISSNESGLSLSVKYRIEKNYIIFTVPDFGDVPVEITNDGLKTAVGELYEKKANSSTPTVKGGSSQANDNDVVTDSDLDTIKSINAFLKNFKFKYDSGPVMAAVFYEFNDPSYTMWVTQLLDLSGNAINIYKATGTYKIQKENNKFYVDLYPEGGSAKSDFIKEADVNQYEKIFYGQTKFEFIPGVLDSDHSVEKSLLSKELIKLTDLPTCILNGTGMLVGRRKVPNWSPEAKAESLRISDSIEKAEKYKRDIEEKLKGRL